MAEAKVVKKGAAVIAIPGVNLGLAAVVVVPEVLIPKEAGGLVPGVPVVPVEAIVPDARLLAQLNELEANRVSMEASRVQLAAVKLALERDLLVLELAKAESEHRRVLAGRPSSSGLTPLLVLSSARHPPPSGAPGGALRSIIGRVGRFVRRREAP